MAYFKERRRNAPLSTDDRKFEQARNLGKVTKFGHRRKAETASVQAVGAVGNLAYGVGDLTAGGDMGGTKIAGTVLKALKAGYEASKKLVKRARRIHKLRTTKNKINYGDNTERGALWGAKQFFVGDVDKQRGHVTGSINASGVVGNGKHKSSSTTLDDAQKKKHLKQMTLQLERRTGDLIGCLKTDDEGVRKRAVRIVHVIAETNLAGRCNPEGGGR